ncbi:MAG: glycosyltransferase family 4 protein [Candidatus Heimdallarchaeota archaeon]|nr:glycosyltransferase family 4 protein [Candidatus Heimdallarchaeota archaeon]
MGKKTRILVVLSDILGNKFYGQRIREALDGVDEFDKLYLTLGPDDYQKYPAPPIHRLSDTMHIAWIMERKYLEECADAEFDGVLFATWEPMMGVSRHVRDKRIISSFDLTPELSFKMVDAFDKVSNKSFLQGTRTLLKKALLKPYYNKTFRSADYFLPWGGEWAKESVINDYGIAADRVDVLPRPIDTDYWAPLEGYDRKNKSKRTLLFVGNDFKRKGGLFLLNVFEELYPYCELRIISNDECLKGIEEKDGLRIYRGLTHDNIDEIRRLYQTSDLFIFPTLRDAVPNVLSEAIASGLVALVSDHLPGLRDMVINGENGYLLKYGDEKLWVEKIKELVQDNELFERMSSKSRQIACERLSVERFKEIIISSVKRLSNE